MIDAIKSKLPLGNPSTAVNPADVADSDVQRFRLALNGGDTGGMGNTQAMPSTGVTAVSRLEATPSAAQAPVTAGDAILSGLKAASTDISQAWLQATEAAGKPSISTAEMLGVQATLLQASVHFELLSKGITKTTQSLDQILKTQ